MTRLNWERLKAREAVQDVLREERERAPLVTGRGWYCGQCGKRLRKDLDAALICRGCRSKVAGN